MRNCSFCGAEIPDEARFCGRCGHTLQLAIAETDGVLNGGPREDVSTFISDVSYPGMLVADRGAGPGEGPDSWPERGSIEEEETIVSDPFLFLAGSGSVQTEPGVPTVHGTPQVGHVPTVHGTPAGAGNLQVGPGMGMHSGLNVGMHAAPPQPLPHTPLPPAPELSEHHPPQPPHTQHPAPEKNSPFHHHPTHPAPEKPRLHGKRSHEHASPHATAPRQRRARPRIRGKRGLIWASACTAALVVVAGSMVLLLVIFPVHLTLRGGKTVSAGDVLHLQGSGFLPRQPVALSLDNTVSFKNSPLADQGGTFDAAISVSKSWTLGLHTIRASQNFARSASVSFTIVALPAKLITSASSLNFGELESGQTIILSLGIGNGGGQPLRWKASLSNTSWLEVLQGAGIINAGSPQQFLYVRANGRHLQPGTYTASVTIDSNGGTASIPVSLQIKQRVPPRGVLSVSQTNIDLGQVEQGQQATATFSIGNEGTLALNWQLSAGSANWLSFDNNSGQIQPGATPQTIHMMADTSSLSVDSYTATVQVSSNGGSATIAVTLQVLPAQTPVTPASTPTLGASPNSFSAPQDPDCSYDPAHGWTCQAQLDNAVGTSTNLQWSASSTGISGVTFTPASGTLLPGNSQSVNIFIPNTPCPAGATFTFKGPGNSVSIPWNCAPAQLLTNPTSFTDACQTCTVTLSLPQGAEGQLQWSVASIPSTGISISPTSGTLTPGQPAQVTFSGLPNNCNTTFDFRFTGPNNGVDVHVPWGCQYPHPSASTTSINANTDCPYNSGWTCTVTLSADQSGAGTLAWSTSSSGISGINFAPASGTLTPGQSGVQVTITIPPASCPSNANLVFTFPDAPNDTITIAWQCAAPALQFSPSSITVPSASCSYSFVSEGYLWTCQETLALQNRGDPDLDWSTAGGVGGSSIQYSPASGTVSVGHSAQVTITISDMACPASTTLTFFAGGNTYNIPWQCSTPSWSAVANNPGSNPSLCSSDGNGNWTCIVAISEDGSSQGDLSWSITSDISGVSYSPASSGQITPGNSTSLTITIPGSVCTGTFTVTDNNQSGDTRTLNWGCSSSSSSSSAQVSVPVTPSAPFSASFTLEASMKAASAAVS